MITSTRSNKNEDARRDFDNFDVDVELARLREALRQGQWRVAGELAANLDEHVSRGGSLPVAWLGTICMQEKEDLETRLEATLEVADKMSVQERQDAFGGYVAVAPALADRPGSSWGIHCNEGGCCETLSLARTTATPPTHEDDYQNLSSALCTSAVSLGWRIWRSVWWCPTHTVAKLFACAHCGVLCPACACPGGPRCEAVNERIIDVTEPKP